MIKNLLCAVFALTLLAGCATPSNKLSIEPVMSVPTRDLAFLMQEIVQKQMMARGYTFGSPAAADVIVVINKLNADISEGSLRHNISAKADISVVVSMPNGSTNTKTYRTSYNVQGPFGASNDKIAAEINNVLSELVSDMAKDPSVSQYIKSNAR